MKTYSIAAIVFLLFAFSACDQNQSIEPSYDFIKFDSEGEPLILSKEYGLPSIYYKRDNQDQLGLILQDEQNRFLVEIHLMNSDILTKSYPYTFNNQNIDDGYSTMQLIDLRELAYRNIRQDTVFGKTDSVNYKISSFDNFTLTVNSFDDKILRGEFRGELKTSTGKSKIVSNGQFKIKIDFVTSY